MIIVNGRTYTEVQVEQALKCARIVMEAYALASEDNGGGSSVDWGAIDMAYEQAYDAFDDATREEINREAKEYNK